MNLTGAYLMPYITKYLVLNALSINKTPIGPGSYIIAMRMNVLGLGTVAFVFLLQQPNITSIHTT